MKKYSTIYYLLFVLIVTGIFASMAQNSYGLKICGVACLGFLLTFLHEIFLSSRGVTRGSIPSWVFYAELVAVSVISLVFMARNFAIDVALSASVWIAALIVLLITLVYHGVIHVRERKAENKRLALPLALYYLAAILFILAWLGEALTIRIALLFVIGGMLAIIGFLVANWLTRSKDGEGESMPTWQYIGQFKNKSAILLITCLLVYGYDMLYSAGALPPLYHGNLPPGYHELVEVGEQTSNVSIQEKQLEFKVAYEKFVSRYAANK